MRQATRVLVALVIVVGVGCSDDEPEVAAPTTTQAPQSDDARLAAPDLGCNVQSGGQAADYTGGAETLGEAVAVNLRDVEAEIVSENAKYGWVVAPADAPTARYLFFDGGSGWALFRADHCFDQ